MPLIIITITIIMAITVTVTTGVDKFNVQLSEGIYF